MAKGNILKEAIADAKAVREVALANAKAALEEAFTPKLQNMLSAKLEEDLDEDLVYDEDEDVDLDLGEMDMEDTGEEDSIDEEIDLEEILNELELEEGDDSDSEDAEEELEEAGGLNQEKPNYTADDVQKVTASEKNIYEKKANEDEFNLDVLLKEINSLEDNKKSTKNVRKLRNESKNKSPKRRNISESKAIRKKIAETRNFGCKPQNKRIQILSRQLQESQQALDSVKGELNEVNLLNSKLLYVNRIFKANQLDDSQKLRVVETLDKADSTKEAKLIYETIKDTFKVANNKKVSNKKQTKTIKENFRGMASKAAGMSRTKKTAPKRAIISESDNMVNRFQKLANIKINQ